MTRTRRRALALDETIVPQTTPRQIEKFDIRSVEVEPVRVLTRSLVRGGAVWTQTGKLECYEPSTESLDVASTLLSIAAKSSGPRLV